MGFFVWYVVSESRTITASFQIPVYFDNAPENSIKASETTGITLQGTRKVIQYSKSHGALHFDGAKLKSGTHIAHIKKENLLLPSSAKVLNYIPIEVTLTSPLA